MSENPATLTVRSRQEYNSHASTSPPTSDPPGLWNPNAAVLLSVLFSPAFGAFLHARNADALGRVNEAEANRMFFYLWIVYFGVTLTPIPIPHGIAIGLLLVWYLILGRNQVAYVKEKWGDGYKRKPWATPLLVGSCCLLCGIVVFVVAKELAISSR
jgi:hypothetical protein